MDGKININGYTVEYAVKYKKVKNINIHVKESYVEVSMPRSVSRNYLENLLRKKVDFIKAAAQRITLARSQTSLYADGSDVKLGGNSYKVVYNEGEPNSVKIENEQLIFTCKNPSVDIVKKMFLTLLIRAAKQNIDKAMDNIFPKFVELGVAMPKIIMRNMVSLWGSCKTQKSTILLNNALGLLAYNQVEYVVAHELAHFIVPNHSKAFHKVLDDILPNNRALSKSLKAYNIRQYFKQ